MEQCCIHKILEEIKALYFAANEEDSLDDFYEWFRSTARLSAYKRQGADYFEELEREALNLLNNDTRGINKEMRLKEARFRLLVTSTVLVCLELCKDEKCPKELKKRWQEMLPLTEAES